MKTIKFIVIGLLLFFAVSAKTQISLHVAIGTPPQWGPSGYTDVRYYYLPDVEAYYDVPSSKFIYFNGVSWVHRSYLPVRYKNYDLYRGYKVVMTDYRGNSPYAHFKEHKSKYAKGYRGKPQTNYGELPEQKKSDNHDNKSYSKQHDDNEKHANSKNKKAKNSKIKSKKK